ncbi:MAG: ABC-2 family transporter protein, partial [Treponema sp.]|nr:ABC-2 family transporter protein [Treponema sp.]
AYYPSLAILRPDNIPILTWISPLFGIVLFWLSYKLWMKGATKYDGSGS